MGSDTVVDDGQVSTDAAEVYDAFFVPALFGQFTERMAATLDLNPGEQALDVACGTGALALALRERVGPAGAVTGLDRNPGMLAVAQGKAEDIAWIEGRAEAVPFADASFDAVGSQFGLMFFEGRVRALREMLRVLRPGGRIAVAVWDSAERSPGYAAMIDLIDRLFGRDTADLLRSPFVLGDHTALKELATKAGLSEARVETWEGTARFESIEAWVKTDVRGWTLAEVIDDAGYALLLEAAKTELAHFADAQGRVRFDAPALVLLAQKS